MIKNLLPLMSPIIQTKNAQSRLKPFARKYFFNNFIYPIAKDLQDRKFHDDDYITIMTSLKSDTFQCLIDKFLTNDDYLLNSKDIAVALSMGISSYSDNSINNILLIDVSLRIIGLLKREKSNLLFKFLYTDIGHKIEELDDCDNREDIEELFSEEKKVFDHYFEGLNSKNYSDKIRIYYPAEGISWIDRNKEDSIEISVYNYQVFKGFFLLGFDYYSEEKGYLKYANRIDDYEYYNGKNGPSKDSIWVN